MKVINQLLNQREKEKNPIQVAVLGSGWYGRGLIAELHRCAGLCPRIIFTRDTESGVAAYGEAGVEKSHIAVVRSEKDMKNQWASDKYLVTDQNELMKNIPGIDVFYDATGNIGAGAQAAIDIINQQIHFITVSAELDCTIGYYLNHLAKEKGIIYSNSDGDQPGVLARMIEEAKLMGFEIIVAGNCKGFIDVHKTPDDILPWVRPGHNSKMVTAFTDGTKQATELTVLANAYGLTVDQRGMHGPTTTKDTLVQDFLKIISRKGIVDYVLGINGVNQGGGVFVIGKREGQRILADLEYLKKGPGPYYLFFKDEHMCYFVSTTTIVEAALLNVATLAPTQVSTDVVCVAKRDLKKGEQLDGMGGYMSYGLIDNARKAKEENLLPIGLSEGAVLNRDVAQDTPISYTMVDYPQENFILDLRQKQDALIF